MQIILRAQARLTGSKYYFTGEACSHGHVAERYVCSASCVICTREKALLMQRQHPEKARARDKRYRERHPEKAPARQAAMQIRNPLLIRTKSLRWREKNLDKAREACRNYYHANVDEQRARMRQWSKKNPDAAKALNHRRRARLMNAPGSFDAGEIAALLKHQHGLCAGCSIDITSGYTVDHKVPLIAGGSNDRSNLQLLCQPCNCSKGSKTMEQWGQMHRTARSKHVTQATA